jgi:GT2 family glycosyltransferase
LRSLAPRQTSPITFNDIDLCLKLRAKGYKNIWTPDAILYHHEAATRGPDDSAEKVGREMLNQATADVLDECIGALGSAMWD